MCFKGLNKNCFRPKSVSSDGKATEHLTESPWFKPSLCKVEVPFQSIHHIAYVCLWLETMNMNTDEKCMTGILLWDLSAAFDTLDPELMCRKLKAYCSSHVIFILAPNIFLCLHKGPFHFHCSASNLFIPTRQIQ